MLLFPEGTTTNGRAIISFQLGAFIPGYPIQPVIVHYPHVHFDQSWGNISLAMLMFRMFTQFHNFMEVEYLPVISPLENMKENAVQLSGRTSHAIATALNVVQTSHSYVDMLLYARASELKQEKPWLYMVEMAWVGPAFHLSTFEALDLLDVFLLMNPDSSGHVEIHNFLKILGLKHWSISMKIFQFIDLKRTGKITFKQFLLGSAHILKQPGFPRACELAFAGCDANGKNYISEEELRDSIAIAAVPCLTTEEVHDLFIVFDTDCDGRISKEDFISCLKRNPVLIGLFSSQISCGNC